MAVERERYRQRERLTERVAQSADGRDIDRESERERESAARKRWAEEKKANRCKGNSTSVKPIDQ